MCVHAYKDYNVRTQLSHDGSAKTWGTFASPAS